MTTLTVIAEPFPDWEADVQAAGARDLVQAIADTAPRSCSARFLMARGSADPEFTSPLISTEQLPFRAGVLPILWQRAATARPLDGEFVHACSPLTPLRARGEDDGSQTSVTVTHGLAWEAPDLLGKSHARTYRSFTRRAVRLADVILTTTHATARVLQHQYGAGLPVQVIPLAPPREYLAAPDHSERRSALGLPDHYLLTTAMPGEPGRLEWVFEAMRSDISLPSLVILAGLDPFASGKSERGGRASDTAEGSENGGATESGTRSSARAGTAEAALRASIPSALEGRVVVVTPRGLEDVGAVLGGATMLLQPQSFLGSGYTLLGALCAGVPVLHARVDAASELVLDGGLAVENAQEFAFELSGVLREEGRYDRLSVLARDRGRSFSWRSAAWQLWETHANL